MNGKRLNERDVFNVARKIDSPEAREDYLQQVCGDDQALLNRIVALLDVHDEEDSFLESPPQDVEITIDAPITEGPGAIIGPYKLMEGIGEGGFGLVFVAEQRQPLRRKLALKIIKPGMDTKEIIARFEAERQTLALMDHPNIARVFDAGTTDSGRPYFVMELVKGISIIDYCDQHQLTTRERLGLFISVCQAVQHAHSKGIIHRDLKPSNILVAPHDGIPVVKVIDFGVAKAIGQQLTDKTIYTSFGQMIGTPLYMSPEQAELNALDVDIRSDIYSLGVLLYELLTGTTPFDRKRFATVAYDEIRRIIREEEPPKPSRRLSTLGETLSTVSANRKTEPARLSALVKGDLDWIVMKTLEKDRTRRYETANGFAADIRRYLSDEAVEARPPSAAYRFQKFARRNKVAFATSAIVAVALLLGIFGTTWQAIQKSHEAVRATRAERDAQALLVSEKEARLDAERSRQEMQKQRDLAESLAEQRRRQQYISDMNAAMVAWEDGNFTRVSDLLRRHVPESEEADLRRFEWYYLWRAYHQNRKYRTIPVGEMPTSMSFFGDEKNGLLAMGDAWGTVTLWNLNDGIEPSHQVLKHGQTGNGIHANIVLFSPDGRILVYADLDTNSLVLYAVDSGDELTRLDYSGTICAISFSRDGRLLAATTRDELGLQCMANVWDAESGDLLNTFRTGPLGGGAFDFHKVAFSHDSRLLALGTTDGEMEVWDWNEQKQAMPIPLIPTRTSRPNEQIYSVALSPEDDLLAAGLHDGTVRVWDWNETNIAPMSRSAKQGERAILLGHSEPVYCVTFSPDGKILASGSSDGTVTLWDADDLTEIRTLSAHSDAVVALQFFRGGRTLVSAGLDYSVRFWPIQRNTEGNRLDGQDQHGELVFLDPSTLGRISGGEVKCWPLDDAESRIRLPDVGTDVQCITMSRHGVLAVKTDSDVELWRLATGSKCGSLRVSHDFAIAKNDPMAFSRDGRVLALGSQNGRVHVWSVGDGQLRSDFEVRAGVESLALNLDGSVLAIAGNEKTLTLWDTDTGNFRDALEGPRDILDCVAFSPDGRLIAAGGYDNAVWLWRWQT